MQQHIVRSFNESNITFSENYRFSWIFLPTSNNHTADDTNFPPISLIIFSFIMAANLTSIILKIIYYGLQREFNSSFLYFSRISFEISNQITFYPLCHLLDESYLDLLIHEIATLRVFVFILFGIYFAINIFFLFRSTNCTNKNLFLSDSYFSIWNGKILFKSIFIPELIGMSSVIPLFFKQWTQLLFILTKTVFLSTKFNFTKDSYI
jgi:hypothetical protein